MSDRASNHDSRVGRQVSRALFGTSAVVVSLACLVLAGVGAHHELSNAGRAIEGLTGTLAPQLEDAIESDDAASASRILSSAGASQALLGIALYRHDGERFAAMTNGQVEFPAHYDRDASDDEAPPALQRGLDGRRYIEHREIAQAGDPWGVMLVYWDVSTLWSRLGQMLLLTLAFIALAGIASRKAAQRLHARVGGPLEGLAAEARILSEHAPEEDALEGDPDAFQILRRALASMSQMQLAVSAVDDNTLEIAQVSHSLRHVSAAMRQDAETGHQAADECSGSIARFAESSLDIGQAVERLGERYRETTTAIHATGESIGEITNQMNELARSIERVANGTHESAASAHQISVAMNGIRDATSRVSELASRFTQAVADVEERATETASLSERSNQCAEKGALSVQQTVHAMGEVDESFTEMSNTVGELANRCDEIGESLAVIESIADETRLLALNAAIIAAQSGEHGRSFAVVAEGIRLLSDRSITSARVIHDSLQSLQASAAQATKTVAEGGEKVTLGVARSTEATHVLGEILEATSSAAAQMRKISESTRNQTRDIAIVKEGLFEVGTLIDASSHAADEQERVGQDMSQAMVSMNQTSRTIEGLLDRQTTEARVISDAAEAVNSELASIRAGTEAQEREGARLQDHLDVFGRTTESAQRRAASVHDLVEILVAQASRLRAKASGGNTPGAETAPIDSVSDD